MASIKEIRTLYQAANLPLVPATSRALSVMSPAGTSLPASTRTQASGGNPYDAAGTGRRMMEFQPSRLGPTSGLWGTLDLMRARCRDEIRNNPYAASAADNFESQVIGNGIKPKWNITDPKVKLQVEREWNRWALSTDCDASGMLNFYGLQALAAREVFEAGEVFNRMYVRPSSWNLRVPFQNELIEGEQCPVWQNIVAGGSGPQGMPIGNTVRTGIEFDKDKRKIAYHMYQEHPGEMMFFPMSGMTFVRIHAIDMLHMFKPLRVGQLRGQPMLTSVLALLHTLEKYTDAALVKKEIQTMFAGFIEKADPAADVLPTDSVLTANGNGPTPLTYTDPGVQTSKLETGTLQVLFPGEKITFPTLPQDTDIETFLRVCLHKFAAGVGATYEQVTGDLKGVTYSSIRAGLLDFRRKCEQFQLNIIIRQFCQPIAVRWLYEAVMAGVIILPGYAQDRGVYEDISWNPPGWAWVDPLKDVQAAQMAVRSGFDSRESVVAEGGKDVATVDNQQAADNRRSDEIGLVYDTDPRNILLKGSQNPDVAPDAAPSGKDVDDAEDFASEQ